MPFGSSKTAPSPSWGSTIGASPFVGTCPASPFIPSCGNGSPVIGSTWDGSGKIPFCISSSICSSISIISESVWRNTFLRTYSVE